jgi:hypothetical protein
MEKLSKVPRVILYGLSILLFCIFFYILYGNVFSKGVCHADDAYIAIGAKNLAFGYGYSSSIEGSFGLTHFPASFTTGPTLSLPTALLIRLVGNRPWVPGFTSTTIILLLLVLIFFTIRNKIGISNTLFYFLLLFFLLYNLTVSNHFPQWFALLGEIPAALLCILGVLILSASPDNRSSILLCCLAFGLAFMTKMLSLLGFIPVLVWFMVTLFKQKNDRKKLIINYLLGIILFLAPYILFDLYKLSVLGMDAYIKNYHDFFIFFNALSLSHEIGQKTLTLGPLTFNSSPLLRLTAFNDQFGYSLLRMILVALLIGVLIYFSKKDKYVNTIFIMLLAGSFLHLLWWTCISNGRPRYALIGLFLYFTAICCILLLNSSRIFKFSIIIVLIFVFISSYKALINPIVDVIKYKYSYTPYEKSLLKTVDFLNQQEKKRPFIYTWWATVGDIEYSLPKIANFKRMDDLDEGDFKKELILVKNTTLENSYYTPKFKLQESRFDEILFDAPPFQVARYRNRATILTSDNPIDFSEKGNSGDYITFGWGIQESTCHWTTRSHAGLIMKFLNKSRNDIIFRLLGYGFLGKGAINFQLVNVLFNNKNLTQWKVDSEKWYEATIPSQIINDSLNSMTFEISNPLSPADCGYNSDTRTIGIAVKMISVSEKQK